MQNWGLNLCLWSNKRLNSEQSQFSLEGREAFCISTTHMCQNTNTHTLKDTIVVLSHGAGGIPGVNDAGGLVKNEPATEFQNHGAPFTLSTPPSLSCRFVGIRELWNRSRHLKLPGGSMAWWETAMRGRLLKPAGPALSPSGLSPELQTPWALSNCNHHLRCWAVGRTGTSGLWRGSWADSLASVSSFRNIPTSCDPMKRIKSRTFIRSARFWKGPLWKQSHKNDWATVHRVLIKQLYLRNCCICQGVKNDDRFYFRLFTIDQNAKIPRRQMEINTNHIIVYI